MKELSPTGIRDMHGKFIYAGDRVISYNHIAAGEDWHKLKAGKRFGRGVFGFIAKPAWSSVWCVITDEGTSSGVYGPMVLRLYQP